MLEPKRARWTSALLAVELALTLILLTGAGLLVATALPARRAARLAPTVALRPD